MKTIHKFPFQTADQAMLTMPRGANILCVQAQHGVPCLWALVDPSKPAQERRLRVYGTGHPCDENAGDYIGTYQLSGGALIFHVFDAGWRE